MMWPAAAHAQLAGSADAGRVGERVEHPPLQYQAPEAAPIETKRLAVDAPKGSEQIHLTLRAITLEGASADEREALQKLYAPYINQDITLDTIWKIAALITDYYQSHGYFLSRAMVPPQEVATGEVRIKIVEGFIHEIALDDTAKSNWQVRNWVQKIRDEKPLNYASLERLLLRLNQLAGYQFRAVLGVPDDSNAPEGATKLSIVTSREAPKARVSYDNFGSRYLGPYQVNQSYTLGIIPNQKTTLNALTTSAIDELRYFSLTQEIPLAYRWTLDGMVNYTEAHPGSSLTSQEIVSNSRSYAGGITYHAMISREQNLALRMGIESRDVRSKLLGTVPLANDSVRALRGNLNFQRMDSWLGMTFVSANISQGLTSLGASREGAANLSRAQAVPDFTKFDATITRFQALPYDMTLQLSASGQKSNDPLFSSEEYGFGGQSFGRAYDASDITGDSGAAASAELRYEGLPTVRDVTIAPYAFYDIGKVWNNDTGSIPLSGSSAGGGVRLNHDSGVYSNLGLAYPLTREISNPVTNDADGPRVMFQMGVNF